MTKNRMKLQDILALPALLILLFAFTPAYAEGSPEKSDDPELAKCIQAAGSDVSYLTSPRNLPTVAQRDGLFRSTGILPHVEQLDQLDRDVLYIRASHLPFHELIERSTYTAPPVKYSDLIPCQDLLALWKSFRKTH